MSASSNSPPPPPPRRRWGQNFLVDAGACRRIAEALLEDGGDETIVEIGPGRGALTRLLVEGVAPVVGVERDPLLARRLREELDGGKLRIVEADVLRYEPPDPCRIVGNLPYNISKPIARWVVQHRERVRRAVLMFQREVADRLLARPGSKDYGPLTILVGRVFEVRRLFDLGPGAFRPRPKVVSCVTRWVPAGPPLSPAQERRLCHCLSVCFTQRRRTLFNNLRADLDGGDAAARALLESVGVDPGSRAEAQPPEVFLALAREWPDIIRAR